MKYLFLLSFVAISSGCQSLIPEPTLSDVEKAKSHWKNSSLELLRSGKNVYIVKCSGCHSLIPPQQHTYSKWSEELVVMNKKAKLDSLELVLIKQYLWVSSRADTLYYSD